MKHLKPVCEICNADLTLYGGFTVGQHEGVVVDIESLDNLCFHCFGRVPKHLPRSQFKKWLKGKLNE